MASSSLVLPLHFESEDSKYAAGRTDGGGPLPFQHSYQIFSCYYRGDSRRRWRLHITIFRLCSASDKSCFCFVRYYYSPFHFFFLAACAYRVSAFLSTTVCGCLLTYEAACPVSWLFHRESVYSFRPVLTGPPHNCLYITVTGDTEDDVWGSWSRHLLRLISRRSVVLDGSVIPSGVSFDTAVL